jgi:ACS family hexuronate transporter-like MFS transporter
MFFTGPPWGLAAFFFIGWGVNGIFPLFMATVPSESVDLRLAGTVLGLCMGVPEVLGGVLAPPIAGFFADNLSLSAPLWMMVGLTLLAGFAAMGLRETSPRHRKDRPAVA